MPTKKARTFSYEDEGKYTVKQTTGKNARTSKNVFEGLEPDDRVRFTATKAGSRSEHDYLMANRRSDSAKKSASAAKKNESAEKKARSKAPSTWNASRKK